ncbi:hypothetical protein AVEN_267280-1 [Araneus ventricosus]|uniref:Uncharacterized protein n=1 Tax=Araneus ventricosus TaxID=182803 RepID=A0A4Y2S582_ARAVE|nr:hypothetical protein AVEN_267280-1 [Araneus ventricosus]
MFCFSTGKQNLIYCLNCSVLNTTFDDKNNTQVNQPLPKFPYNNSTKKTFNHNRYVVQQTCVHGGMKYQTHNPAALKQEIHHQFTIGLKKEVKTCAKKIMEN